MSDFYFDRVEYTKQDVMDMINATKLDVAVDMCYKAIAYFTKVINLFINYPSAQAIYASEKQWYENILYECMKT